MTGVVQALLADLTDGIAGVLGADLLGLYLYGSLVTGDFDERISDVDLLAVLRNELSHELSHELSRDRFGGLDEMHGWVVARHPAWYDRIEVAYLGAAGLTAFRHAEAPIAVISPGEPFHRKTAGADWLLNWYVLQEWGQALLGPPVATLFEPITVAEVHAAVGRQMEDWREHVYSSDHPGFRSYAVLTACRALYTHEHGQIASKLRSAAWARDRVPEWAALIDQAIEVRSRGGRDADWDSADTARFVNAIADRVGR